MKTLTLFAAMLSVILMSACGTTRIEGSATEREICRQMGESLPTRSKSDTQQTIDEISETYAKFALVCPGWEHLIP